MITTMRIIHIIIIIYDITEQTRRTQEQVLRTIRRRQRRRRRRRRGNIHIQKNKIKELPEGLGKLIHLEIVDVAANEIRIFPTEVSQDYSRIFCSLKICFYGNFSIFFTFQLPVYPGFLFSFSISDDSKLTLNGSMCPRMKESQYFQNPK